MDFSKMDGFEFERFVATLLRRMGLFVEQTPLTGDGGVDLIVNCTAPIVGGVFLVQCKRSSGTIGEPVVRDLYGVVLNNRANKGVIITDSYFSTQAQRFAEGKNMELIDRGVLQSLATKYGVSDVGGQQAESLKPASHFTTHPEFDTALYEFLVQERNHSVRDYDKHRDLLNFLYKHVMEGNLDIIYSGLIPELLSCIDALDSRFSKRGPHKDWVCQGLPVIKGTLLLLLGRIDDAVKLLLHKRVLHNTNDLPFGVKDRHPYHLSHASAMPVESLYFYPHTYKAISPTTVSLGNPDTLASQDCVEDPSFRVYKANLVSTLSYLDDSENASALCNSLLGQIEAVLRDRKFSRQTPVETLDMITNRIEKDVESTLNLKEGRLFIPTSVQTVYNGFASASYSMDHSLYVKDVVGYWPGDVDLEAQKERIRLYLRADPSPSK